MMLIEVCQGPDCLGGGGGAVLLELEDLVSECQQHKNILGLTGGQLQLLTNEKEMEDEENEFLVQAIPGGCRNFCTMGPNVHVHHVDADARREEEEEEEDEDNNDDNIKRKDSPAGSDGDGQVCHYHHFTKVSGMKECKAIARKVGILLNYEENDIVRSDGKEMDSCGNESRPTTATTATSSPLYRMLVNKADRLYWQALRDLARLRTARNGSTGKSKMSCGGRRNLEQKVQLQLQQAHQAAAAVATRPPQPHPIDAIAREQRRNERLELIFQKLIISSTTSKDEET